jgi:hypothetical protein
MAAAVFSETARRRIVAAKKLVCRKENYAPQVCLRFASTESQAVNVATGSGSGDGA